MDNVENSLNLVSGIIRLPSDWNFSAYIGIRRLILFFQSVHKENNLCDVLFASVNDKVFQFGDKRKEFLPAELIPPCNNSPQLSKNKIDRVASHPVPIHLKAKYGIHLGPVFQISAIFVSTGPEVIKLFFMLNSVEYESLNAH